MVYYTLKVFKVYLITHFFNENYERGYKNALRNITHAIFLKGYVRMEGSQYEGNNPVVYL